MLHFSGAEGAGIFFRWNVPFNFDRFSGEVGRGVPDPQVGNLTTSSRGGVRGFRGSQLHCLASVVLLDGELSTATWHFWREVFCRHMHTTSVANMRKWADFLKYIVFSRFVFLCCTQGWA